MKKALLIYQTNPKTKIFNIGDYIQSLSASQFFADKIDAFINRERLDEYNGDDVKLIMNGWFMHDPDHWPPSPKIHPLFISFHINSLAKNKLISEDSIRYLKQFEPIGCRDRNSTKLLHDKGIHSYFSGCLTLTLSNNYKSNNPKREKFIFVDPIYKINKSAISLLKLSAMVIMNWHKMAILCKKINGRFSFRKLFQATAFYEIYSKLFLDNIIMNASYIHHEITDNFPSENSKFDFAQNLLHIYAEAKLVITSRIHCALPCLALDTPVLYIENINQSEVSSCRLDGIKELFNIIKYDHGKLSCDLLKGKVTNDTELINSDKYISIRDNLTIICNSFIEA